MDSSHRQSRKALRGDMTADRKDRMELVSGIHGTENREQAQQMQRACMTMSKCSPLTRETRASVVVHRK